MFNQIISKIKQYDIIIIHRHIRPDMDALGSQLGLKYVLKNTFPDKKIYAVGSNSRRFNFLEEMDVISNDLYKNALVIVTDTSPTHLIDDDRYKLGHYLIKIDHHNEDEQYGDISYVDTSRTSACSIIVDLCMQTELNMTKEAASVLYAGLITDSGRFLYSSVNSDTFKFASYLINYDINIPKIYSNIYTTSLDKKRLNGYVLSNFVVDEHLAYMKFFDFHKEVFNADLNTLKSGTVNLMSNIENIPAWVTFTEHEDQIFVEIRGIIKVVDIAKKYGGGGHDHACGATVQNWEDVSDIINDLKKLCKEYINEGKNT